MKPTFVEVTCARAADSFDPNASNTWPKSVKSFNAYRNSRAAIDFTSLIFAS